VQLLDGVERASISEYRAKAPARGGAAGGRAIPGASDPERREASNLGLALKQGSTSSEFRTVVASRTKA